MQTIKVVIGANFGDEGKGLMTDYFCHQAAAQGKSACVVLYNGGAQRGHTVCTPHGKRHVFHHVSSGTFCGAHTYFAPSFVLNPMLFVEEQEQLNNPSPLLITHPKCRVSTPYDMIFNQLVEANRGKDRHGSCGAGIFETVTRYKNPAFQVPFEEMSYMFRHWMLESFLKEIRDDYYGRKLEALNTKVPDEWLYIWFSDSLIKHYLRDFDAMRMLLLLEKKDTKTILQDYEYIVFEGGQGLLLDQNNKKYFPYLTPSNTGLKNPSKIISRLTEKDLDVEVCYVTRSYLTRHGAGPLENECETQTLSPKIEDDTNVENEHQGALRYAKLDALSLFDRAHRDFKAHAKDSWKISLAVTHLDQYPLVNVNDVVRCFFDKVYMSDGKTRCDVYRVK